MDKTTKEIICSVCELPIAGDEDYRTDEGGPYHFSDVTCVVRLKERLRSIEAAAVALGPDSPYVFVDIVRHCFYCHGPRIIDEHMEQHWQHDPLCEWPRFQAALEQGQAGERGGSGSGDAEEEGV